MQIPDFHNIVSTLGEDCYFTVYNPGEMPQVEITKMSITNATQAAYSLVDRELLYKGNFVLPLKFRATDLSGQYFERALIPGTQYLIISSILEPTNSKLGFLYAVQCNEIISICKTEEKKDEWGNTKNIYVLDKEKSNINCYFYSILRSFKVQNDGKLDQAMYTLLLPSRYKLSPMQKIIKKSFLNGEYTDEYYLVNSIETALTNVNENEEISGIISAQLTKDIDGGDNLNAKATLF